MEIPVDQLRAQRELVKRHLDWLDAKIAEAGGGAPSPLSVSAPEALASTEPNQALGWKDGAPVASAPAPVPGTATTAPAPAKASAEEAHAEAMLASHSDSSADLGKNAKFGCIVIAIVVVITVFFLLFGLPYLLYKKKADPAQPPGQEQVSP